MIRDLCFAVVVLAVTPAHADSGTATTTDWSIVAMAERPTADSVRRRLEHEVPLGTTRADVIQWLESSGIFFVIGDEQGVLDPAGQVIVGFVKDTRKNAIVKRDVRFKLYFSEAQELKKIEVEDIYTGP